MRRAASPPQHGSMLVPGGSLTMQPGPGGSASLASIVTELFTPLPEIRLPVSLRSPQQSRQKQQPRQKHQHLSLLQEQLVPQGGEECLQCNEKNWESVTKDVAVPVPADSVVEVVPACEASGAASKCASPRVFYTTEVEQPVTHRTTSGNWQEDFMNTWFGGSEFPQVYRDLCREGDFQHSMDSNKHKTLSKGRAGAHRVVVA